MRAAVVSSVGLVVNVVVLEDDWADPLPSPTRHTREVVSSLIGEDGRPLALREEYEVQEIPRNHWEPPEGCTVVETNEARPGWTYLDGRFRGEIDDVQAPIADGSR